MKPLYFYHPVAFRNTVLKKYPCIHASKEEMWNHNTDVMGIPSAGPRRMRSSGHDVHLLGVRIKCTTCKAANVKGYTFYSYDDAVRERLPTPIQNEFPFTLTASSGVDRTVVDRLRRAAQSQQSFEDVRLSAFKCI